MLPYPTSARKRDDTTAQTNICREAFVVHSHAFASSIYLYTALFIIYFRSDAGLCTLLRTPHAQHLVCLKLSGCADVTSMLAFVPITSLCSHRNALPTLLVYRCCNSLPPLI